MDAYVFHKLFHFFDHCEWTSNRQEKCHSFIQPHAGRPWTGHDSPLVTRWAGGSTQIWLEFRLYYLLAVFLLIFTFLISKMGTIPDFLHRVLRIQRDGTLEGYTLEGQNVTFTTCQYNYKSTTCPAWNKMDMVLLRKTLFHNSQSFPLISI